MQPQITEKRNKSALITRKEDIQKLYQDMLL